jgi:hypothetical protein
MHIIHQATIKNPDGIIDIDLFIVNDPEKPKHYIYHLKSEYIAEKFHQYYRRGRGFHRTCLALLNKHKILKGEWE